MRALAALHSTSGSPNKRLSPATAAAAAGTSSSSSRPAAPPLFFDAEATRPATSNGTPKKKTRKAANPFASPQKGAFGAFEREEREKLRARRLQLKKQQQEEKAGLGGGVLGPAAAGGSRAGAGWGSATSVPGAGGGGGGVFERRASRSPATESMDVDQVDDFFVGGNGGGRASVTPRRSSQTARPLDRDQDDDVFDEALGPSPIKPLSSTSGHQTGVVVARPFQSLMPDSPPPPPPSSLASRRPSQSNPYVGGGAPTASSSSSTTRPVPFLVPLPSSTKSTLTAGGGATIVPQKRSDPGASYYADQPTRISSAGDPKRQKLGFAASKNGNDKGKGKGKGKGKTNGGPADSNESTDKTPMREGRKQQQQKQSSSVPEMAGEMILDLDDYDSEEPADGDMAVGADGDGNEDGDGADVKTAAASTRRKKRKEEQIVIRDKGWMARQRALEREKRYPPTSATADVGAEPQADDNDNDGSEEEGEGEGETIDILAFDAADRRELDESFQDPSLFKTSRQPDLLSLLSKRPRSRSRSRSRSPSGSPSRSSSPSTRRRYQADDQAAAAAAASSLPADLAALLSLRTSPTKSQRSSFAAKERQVARLLGEPGSARHNGAGGYRKGGVKGLLDFASEDEDGGGMGGLDRENGDEDDDWDEEVEGWEGAGEAMDGYYSGGGDDL